jgi:hypothetical protein
LEFIQANHWVRLKTLDGIIDGVLQGIGFTQGNIHGILFQSKNNDVAKGQVTDWTTCKHQVTTCKAQ